MENLEKDQDSLRDVAIREQLLDVDTQRLTETASTEKGASQMQYCLKHWEHKRAITAQLVEEELALLSQQRKEIEQKKQHILDEQRFHDEHDHAVKQQVPILDEVYTDEWKRLSEKSDGLSHNQELKIDALHDSVSYWKERAMQLEKVLEASLQRERSLEEKLDEYI